MFTAFVELIILLFAVIKTYKLALKINRKAGLMYIPYIIWLVFAGVLNFSLWFLNTNVFNQIK